MNEGFFHALQSGLGSNAYKSFLTNLSRCLGPYGAIFWMTCKDVKRNFKPLMGPETNLGYGYIHQFAKDGHTNLLQFALDNDWEFSSLGPLNLTSVKWLATHGLLDTQELFYNSCNSNNRKLMDYCIERRYHNGNYLRYTSSLDALDYLYVVRKLPTTSGMWERGFYLRNESLYIWAMQYQSDPHISFVNAFISPDGICHALVHWSQANFKNNWMLKQILEMTQLGEIGWLVPLDVCEKLSDCVARAVDSDACQCNDPENHEELTPTKKQRVFEI